MSALIKSICYATCIALYTFITVRGLVRHGFAAVSQHVMLGAISLPYHCKIVIHLTCQQLVATVRFPDFSPSS